MISALPLSRTLLNRIESEYDEQPGLCVTPQQAQRLWGLDGPTCRAVLTTLEEAHVIQRTKDGRFVRSRSTT